MFKHDRFKSHERYFEYFQNTIYFEKTFQNTLRNYLCFISLKYKCIANTRISDTAQLWFLHINKILFGS